MPAGRPPQYTTDDERREAARASRARYYHKNREVECAKMRDKYHARVSRGSDHTPTRAPDRAQGQVAKASVPVKRHDLTKRKVPFGASRVPRYACRNDLTIRVMLTHIANTAAAIAIMEEEMLTIFNGNPSLFLREIRSNLAACKDKSEGDRVISCLDETLESVSLIHTEISNLLADVLWKGSPHSPEYQRVEQARGRATTWCIRLSGATTRVKQRRCRRVLKWASHGPIKAVAGARTRSYVDEGCSYPQSATSGRRGPPELSLQTLTFGSGRTPESRSPQPGIVSHAMLAIARLPQGSLSMATPDLTYDLVCHAFHLRTMPPKSNVSSQKKNDSVKPTRTLPARQATSTHMRPRVGAATEEHQRPGPRMRKPGEKCLSAEEHAERVAERTRARIWPNDKESDNHARRHSERGPPASVNDVHPDASSSAEPDVTEDGERTEITEGSVAVDAEDDGSGLGLSSARTFESVNEDADEEQHVNATLGDAMMTGEETEEDARDSHTSPAHDAEDHSDGDEHCPARSKGKSRAIDADLVPGHSGSSAPSHSDTEDDPDLATGGLSDCLPEEVRAMPASSSTRDTPASATSHPSSSRMPANIHPAKKVKGRRFVDSSKTGRWSHEERQRLDEFKARWEEGMDTLVRLTGRSRAAVSGALGLNLVGYRCDSMWNKHQKWWWATQRGSEESPDDARPRCTADYNSRVERSTVQVDDPEALEDECAFDEEHEVWEPILSYWSEQRNPNTMSSDDHMAVVDQCVKEFSRAAAVYYCLFGIFVGGFTITITDEASPRCLNQAWGGSEIVEDLISSEHANVQAIIRNVKHLIEAKVCGDETPTIPLPGSLVEDEDARLKTVLQSGHKEGKHDRLRRLARVQLVTYLAPFGITFIGDNDPKTAIGRRKMTWLGYRGILYDNKLKCINYPAGVPLPGIFQPGQLGLHELAPLVGPWMLQLHKKWYRDARSKARAALEASGVNVPPDDDDEDDENNFGDVTTEDGKVKNKYGYDGPKLQSTVVMQVVEMTDAANWCLDERALLSRNEDHRVPLVVGQDGRVKVWASQLSAERTNVVLGPSTQVPLRRQRSPSPHQQSPTPPLSLPSPSPPPRGYAMSASPPPSSRVTMSPSPPLHARNFSPLPPPRRARARSPLPPPRARVRSPAPVRDRPHPRPRTRVILPSPPPRHHTRARVIPPSPPPSQPRTVARPAARPSPPPRRRDPQPSRGVDRGVITIPSSDSDEPIYLGRRQEPNHSQARVSPDTVERANPTTDERTPPPPYVSHLQDRMVSPSSLRPLDDVRGNYGSVSPVLHREHGTHVLHTRRATYWRRGLHARELQFRHLPATTTLIRIGVRTVMTTALHHHAPTISIKSPGRRVRSLVRPVRSLRRPVKSPARLVKGIRAPARPAITSLLLTTTGPIATRVRGQYASLPLALRAVGVLRIQGPSPRVLTSNQDIGINDHVVLLVYGIGCGQEVEWGVFMEGWSFFVTTRSIAVVIHVSALDNPVWALQGSL
ncbi:hypothetical protein CONPUDRAFT_74474 [Coniophora puteana RWD-64-598 SS2]|uniref:Uncharacterized protein n=1 Tax=Coniophora puteana (strain RWD-64-598) TaxID=741705 RepID=A0A5M3MIT8_CONPW|nr:uncharacterized protein CONPUDRAFT_74474 [Coniophora puteana RWD-64-598 SS2]EIW78897.1 hypothetical protein CONPUDRAFT_74474 [Coniophora puteana RWD-64-598 SS2]